MIDLAQAIEAALVKLESEQKALDNIIGQQNTLQATIARQRIAVAEQRQEVERLSAAWAAEADATAKGRLAQQLEQAKADLGAMTRMQEGFNIGMLKTTLGVDEQKSKIAQLRAEHKGLVDQQVLAAVQAAQGGQGGGFLGKGVLGQLKEAQDAFHRMELTLQGVRVQGDPVGEMFHKQKLKIDDAQKAVDKQQKSIETFRAIQQHAAVAFAGGSAGLMGLAAAGSPQAYDTFTQSLQLLATTVGGSLVPYLMKLAYWFQDAAEWVRNLSQETKDGIAKWAVYGVAAAGVTAAGMKLISMLRSAWAVMGQGVAAVRTLVTAIQVASISLSVNPFTTWIVGIGALVAVVYGLSRAFDSLAHGIESASAKASNFEDLLDRLANGGQATREDIRKLLSPAEQLEYVQAKTDKERQQIIEEATKKSQQEAGAMSLQDIEERRIRARQTFTEYQEARSREGMFSRHEGSIRLAGELRGLLGQEEFERIGGVTDRQGRSTFKILSEATMNESVASIGLGAQRAHARLALATNLLTSGRPLPTLQAGGRRHMNALSREAQPHFSPFEEARRQLQIASLGRSPIEEQTLREQRAAWALQEALQQQIVNNTAPRNRPAPIR